MSKCNCCLWGGILLLVGGLVHLIPQLYAWLTALTGGTPWIQIVVGALSVIGALMCLFKKKCWSSSCTPSGGA